MAIVIMILNSILNIVCFFIGFNIASKIKNNEPIEMKEIIPTIPFPKQEEPDTKEIERIKTIYENIDSYNGTGMGQKELP